MSRRENSGLECLQSRKRKLSSLGVKDIPPSSLPSIVNARGHKYDSSFCATPQTECVADGSATVAESIVDTSDQRSHKRHKRSSSIPAASRSSQLPTQLQSRRRSRSMLGSPTANIEYTLPSRVSSRFARKIHPFVNSRSTDIYTYLADPNSPGNLSSGPPADSIILSAPDKVIHSQPIKGARRRQRKVVDLADENTKKDLMEEWARLRQSQGTFSLCGVDENTCFDQVPLRGGQKGDESVSCMRLEAVMQRNHPDPDVARNGTITAINTPQSQEKTILSISTNGFFSTPVNFGNTSLPGVDASRESLGYKDSIQPSSGGTEPVVPSVDMEAPSTSYPDPGMSGILPGDELASVPATTRYCNSLQCSMSSPPTVSLSPLREDSIHIRPTTLARLPVREQAKTVSFNNPSKDSRSVVFQTSSFDSNSVYLDSDEEFCMLDIPEIFTLPWVPVAPHLYLPPGLGKLVSGMKEQLAMEARARRRAEELYQEELGRRVFAEQIIQDLRKELEERH